MKKSTLGFLVGAAGLMLACLCGSERLLPVFTPAAPSTTLPLPTAGPTTPFSTGEPAPICINHLATALQQSENGYSTGEELETDFTLVTYRVSGDTISDPTWVHPIPPKLKSFQDDTAAQARLWRFFTDIIPADQRTEVTEFEVFTDGPNNTLGAVEQTDDPRRWKLEMDIQDGEKFADLSSTLIHEFAHLLTLNDTQVTPDMDVFDHPDDQKIFDQGVRSCPGFFMFEGCSQPDSYINRFFQRFWPSIYDEWKAITDQKGADQVDKDLDRFYEKYADRFLSSYSVTDPQEDIAESFMYFVFTPRPQGNLVSDQKIQFFYEIPELKTLREHILSHLCRYVEK